MPDVIYPGAAGRLEGRYTPSRQENAPLALVLHSHPKVLGHMNNPIVMTLAKSFVDRGFSVLRFNFRGVGRSKGEFEQGLGELSDAAASLDWLQSFNQNAQFVWVAGYSFGAFIGLQLLMRRPEIKGFVAVGPQTNLYDFSFLAPCPSSGAILYGEDDKLVPPDDIDRAMSKVRVQKGVYIGMDRQAGVNHFWSDKLDLLEERTGWYLDQRLAGIENPLPLPQAPPPTPEEIAAAEAAAQRKQESGSDY